MTLREALLAMGYRETRSRQWLKPVGFACFVYSEDRAVWYNYVLGADDGSVVHWNSETFRPVEENNGDFLYQLKYFESTTKVGSGSPRSHFEIGALDV